MCSFLTPKQRSRQAQGASLSWMLQNPFWEAGQGCTSQQAGHWWAAWGTSTLRFDACRWHAVVCARWRLVRATQLVRTLVSWAFCVLCHGLVSWHGPCHAQNWCQAGVEPLGTWTGCAWTCTGSVSGTGDGQMPHGCVDGQACHQKAGMPREQ